MNWVAPIKDYETLENFKKVLKDIDYKYYIMFELGIGTGLQLQDILTFKNKDVRDKSEITVKIGSKNIENTFTVPEELYSLIYSNQKLLYDALYHAAHQTMEELSADPKHLGARIGYICVLHT